jgi:hypothetical protein
MWTSATAVVDGRPAAVASSMESSTVISIRTVPRA